MKKHKKTRRCKLCNYQPPKKTKLKECPKCQGKMVKA